MQTRAGALMVVTVCASPLIARSYAVHGTLLVQLIFSNKYFY
jgi:hypothetical protein